CALAMERPGIGIAVRGTVLVATESTARQPTVPETTTRNLEVKSTSRRLMTGNSPYLLSFSAAFYLVGTLVYAYIKAFYPFVLPIVLNEAGIPSYIVYLVTFAHQGLQTVTIMIWSRKGVKSGHVAWIIAMVANVAFLACLWLAGSPALLTIAFVVNGILSGWLYTFTSMIMLEYGAVENSLKYATFYEFYNGIGFGVAPLVAGALIAIDPGLNYAINAVIVATFCLPLFLASARASARRKSNP
ncbi:MAG: hypothetical protein Q6373_013045, partial [Candidatus Sigynarchaeota archaeon]